MAIAPGGESSDSTRLARLVFRELAAELDRALGSNAASDAASDARADALVEAAARAAREGALGRAAFEGIDEKAGERLKKAFDAAREICGRIGLDVPEPEAFWAAGVDRSAIARGMVADPSLMPVPAPHGLGVSEWTDQFRAAARQTGSPLSLSAPLVIAPEVVAAFATLDEAPSGATSVRSTRRDGAEIRWTLRLIAATPEPPRTGMSHAIGPHPTIAEMFMLQLMLLAREEAPIDQKSFTWLHGTIDGGRFAARALFDTHERSVRVNTREVGNQGPHLGARPPRG